MRSAQQEPIQIRSFFRILPIDNAASLCAPGTVMARTRGGFADKHAIPEYLSSAGTAGTAAPTVAGTGSRRFDAGPSERIAGADILETVWIAHAVC